MEIGKLAATVATSVDQALIPRNGPVKTSKKYLIQD